MEYFEALTEYTPHHEQTLRPPMPSRFSILPPLAKACPASKVRTGPCGATCEDLRLFAGCSVVFLSLTGARAQAMGPILHIGQLHACNSVTIFHCTPKWESRSSSTSLTRRPTPALAARRLAVSCRAPGSIQASKRWSGRWRAC